MRRVIFVSVVCWLLGMGPFANAQPASVDSENSFRLSGSLFSRYEMRGNYAKLGARGRRLGQHDGVAYRSRLVFDSAPAVLGPGWRASVRVSPQASGFWGDTSGGLVDPAIGIHEGRIRIQSSASWLDVGRFEMAYRDHLVVGNVDWHESARSFDGVRAHIEADSGAFADVFGTAVAEGGAGTANSPLAAGDLYFVGIYGGIGPMICSVLDLDVYAFAQVSPKSNNGDSTTDFPTVETTLGLRAAARFGNVSLRTESGVQVGRRASSRERVLAYQSDTAATLQLGPASLRIGGLIASGDSDSTSRDESWNQLYPTAHKFLGHTDLVGSRTNVMGPYASFNTPVVGAVEGSVDAHAFFRPETPDGVQSYAGAELDVALTAILGSGFTIRSEYGAFVPNSDGPFATSTVAHYAELQIRYQL